MKLLLLCALVVLVLAAGCKTPVEATLPEAKPNLPNAKPTPPPADFFLQPEVSFLFYGEHLHVGDNVRRTVIGLTLMVRKTTQTTLLVTDTSCHYYRGVPDSYEGFDIGLSADRDSLLDFSIYDFFQDDDNSRGKHWYRNHSAHVKGLALTSSNDTMVVYTLLDPQNTPGFAYSYLGYSIPGSGLEYKSTNWSGTTKPLVQITIKRR